MFIRLFSRLFNTGEQGGGGGGTPEPVKPDVARTYLADYGHTADALKAMDDKAVVELHGKVTGHLSKSAEAAKKADFDKRTRPEHIPEQFWNAEKREINHEAMAKSWQDFRTQANEKGASKAPKTPEEYAFAPPEGMTLDKDDKILPEFKKVAHKLGLSPEQFQTAAAEMMKSGVLQPAAIDPVAEKAKLGPMADAVIAANTQWGKRLMEAGVWDQQDFNEMIILGSTAEGMRAINKVREWMGGEKIPLTTGSSSPAASVEAWYAKHNAIDPATKKLRIEVDPEYRKQVMDEGEQIFGKGPARSSIPGAGVPR
jgi:hypothetical protein